MSQQSDALLAKLEKVRQRSRDSWVACCPAHEDRSPSLTVRELADGRILMHCFAGCPIDAVLTAVGMKLEDLFPEPLTHHAPPMRRPFAAADVLECVSSEMTIVALEAARLSRGERPSPDERSRLSRAAERISEARKLANG